MSIKNGGITVPAVTPATVFVALAAPGAATTVPAAGVASASRAETAGAATAAPAAGAVSAGWASVATGRESISEERSRARLFMVSPRKDGALTGQAAGLPPWPRQPGPPGTRKISKSAAAECSDKPCRALCRFSRNRQISCSPQKSAPCPLNLTIRSQRSVSWTHSSPALVPAVYCQAHCAGKGPPLLPEAEQRQQHETGQQEGE